MKISRRNLSLLVESLLVEGMSFEDLRPGKEKKILKIYKSIVFSISRSLSSATREGLLGGIIDSMLKGYLRKVAPEEQVPVLLHRILEGDYSFIDYESPEWKEEEKRILMILASATQPITYMSSLIPSDVTGPGEMPKDALVNKGMILTWLVKKSAEDFAKLSKESAEGIRMYDVQKFEPLYDKHYHVESLATDDEIQSPLTIVILNSLEVLSQDMKKGYDKIQQARYDGKTGHYLSARDLNMHTGGWSSDVEKFYMFRHLLPAEKRQLNSFRSYKELRETLEAAEPAIALYKEKKAAKELAAAVQSGAKFFRGGWNLDEEGRLTPNPETEYYTKPDSEGIVVAEELNREAAIAFCRDKPQGREHCAWCTGATVDTNYYEQYASQGPLFYVEIRGKRFQIHFASGQYKDVHDSEIQGNVYEKVLDVLLAELAKEFGGFNEMNSQGVYPAALKIRDKYKGSVYALDRLGYLGPPQY